MTESNDFPKSTRNGVPLADELPVLAISGDYYGSSEIYRKYTHATNLVLQFWADGSVTWRNKESKQP